MKLILIILLSILSSLSTYGQISKTIASFVIENIQDKKNKIQYEKMLNHRDTIGTNQRVDSISYVEFYLLETFNDKYSDFNVTEIYVTKEENSDTLVYFNGKKIDFIYPLDFFTKSTFKEPFEYSETKYKHLHKVITGGCIKFTRKQSKAGIKNNLKHTHAIATKVKNDTIESLILNYPVASPKIIIYRKTHMGGYIW
jgi:hypothetical protein